MNYFSVDALMRYSSRPRSGCGDVTLPVDVGHETASGRASRFREIHGTDRLWVNIDRVEFKPPVNDRYPEYDKGFIHRVNELFILNKICSSTSW